MHGRFVYNSRGKAISGLFAAHSSELTEDLGENMEGKWNLLVRRILSNTHQLFPAVVQLA